MQTRTDLRLSLPSKGWLAESTLDFLASCGLRVHKPNPRQYAARIMSLPSLSILFQRPGDIVVSVRDGSVDFGITGLDVMAEHQGRNGAVVLLHDALGFGQCRLCLAVPEAWADVEKVADLAARAMLLGRALRVATRFPHLTQERLAHAGIPYTLVHAEGTLETAPTIGYADLISDLVSSGQTLRDNRLRELQDGEILVSQAVLIANRAALRANPDALNMARVLLEFFEAHLRAIEHFSVFANMRGLSPEAIAECMFSQKTLGGLQGPTFSRVVVPAGEPHWFAIHIIVRRDSLFQAIAELRAIGGSGVVVSPVSYIFEEEPARYQAMLEGLQSNETHDHDL
jgi:ATP phosphoribosyltransferase